MNGPTPEDLDVKPLAILASLRSADLARLDEEIAALERAGIDGLHIDVMDGDFVPESCFDPAFVADLRARTGLLLDVHLLARDPALLASAYAEAGAHRISFHLEVVADPRAMIRQLRGLEVQPGIVILPSTAVDAVLPLLEEVAVVNPLGVDPTQGIGFQDSTYARIGALAEFKSKHALSVNIQADGGVWAKTREGLVEAGADELVGGFPIFSQPDYAVAIEALRNG